ncbi:MAG: hypothetical protein GWM98_14465, partial [Nitrospinaceae bacterium]|nr:hypothetical protein [Nitrospinaceae bacterium]
MPTIDTPSEAEMEGEIELEDYSLPFILPRIALVLLISSFVFGFPVILWRIWLSFTTLQTANWSGVLSVLLVIGVLTAFWRKRKNSTRDIVEEAETAARVNASVQRQTSFSGGLKYLLRWMGQCWEVFCGSKSKSAGGEPSVSFAGGMQYAVLWLRESWQAFGRLTSLEKEANIYFMLAAIPELLLLIFGSVHLHWSPLTAGILPITVLPGLV